MACLVIVILLAYIEITLAAGATADIKTVTERKEQETQRKKDQLSGVLNAASDGIVVVKSRKRHVGDEEMGRTREHGLPSILFCNTKSITLFGHNFSQTQTGGAPEERAQIALDEPRFTP